jgi:hypothetical protein
MSMAGRIGRRLQISCFNTIGASEHALPTLIVLLATCIRGVAIDAAIELRSENQAADIAGFSRL